MRLRSRITTDGLDRTPHRAFMRAKGQDNGPSADITPGSATGIQLSAKLCYVFTAARRLDKSITRLRIEPHHGVVATSISCC